MQRVRGERRMRARDVATLGPGWHEDGGGLRLVVEPSGTRHWVVRVTAGGKRRTLGLGSFPVVTLDEARDRALDIRRAARNGHDLRRARSVTFRQAFEAWFEMKRQSLTDAEYVKRVPTIMGAKVFPLIGDRPVAEITPADILAVLRPIWFTKPNLAQRMLQWLESVFKSATVHGQRTSASPCLGVAEVLGAQRRTVEHRARPALPRAAGLHPGAARGAGATRRQAMRGMGDPDGHAIGRGQRRQVVGDRRGLVDDPQGAHGARREWSTWCRCRPGAWRS